MRARSAVAHVSGRFGADRGRGRTASSLHRGMAGGRDMRTLLIGLVTAGVATATVAGQNPPPRPSSPQTPTTQTQPRTGTDTGPTVTVQGCLMREADVPGLEPNVVERA